MRPRLSSTAVLALFGAGVIAVGCRSEGPTGGGSGTPRVVPFPAALQVLDGQGQTGMVGHELDTPLRVRVLDSTGIPISGQIVNFRVASGGGALFAGAAITDAQGRAAERWTLGTSAGAAQRVEARAVNPETGVGIVFAVFEATALADVAAKLERQSPDSQGGQATIRVSSAPAVRVVDRYGNGVEGTVVTFRITAGAGSLGTSRVVSDQTGTASAQSWVLGPGAGMNSAVAEVSGLPPAHFVAIASAPPTRPLLTLSAPALTFTATAGGSSTADQSIRVESSGSPINGVTGAIYYASGQPTGWLTGEIGAGTPTTAVLRANPSRLGAGTYAATVVLEATAASNSPVQIPITLIVSAAPPTGAPAQDVCTIIGGASILGDDGTFLGTLTNRFDARSALNVYGLYGSTYSTTSIWNTFGKYGSDYSQLSAFNSLARTPPILYLGGKALAYLSVNITLSPRVDPRVLPTCMFP